MGAGEGVGLTTAPVLPWLRFLDFFLVASFGCHFTEFYGFLDSCCCCCCCCCRPMAKLQLVVGGDSSSRGTSQRSLGASTTHSSDGGDSVHLVSLLYRVLPSFTEFYRVLPSFTEFYRVLPSFPPFSSTPTVLPSFFVPGFVIVIILHFQVLSVFYRALPFSFFNGHFASVHLVVYRVLPSFFFCVRVFLLWTISLSSFWKMPTTPPSTTIRASFPCVSLLIDYSLNSITCASSDFRAPSLQCSFFVASLWLIRIECHQKRTLFD